MARIIFLSEKIISNFGVDRTILNIARNLSKTHLVSLVTTKTTLSLDETGLNIEILDLSHLTFADFWDIDKKYSQKAATIIDKYLIEEEDVIIVCCGWPFIQIANYYASSNHDSIRKIFFDFGLVPRPESDFNQIELRKLRSKYVKYFDKVITISEFLKKSEISLEAPKLQKYVVPLAGMISPEVETLSSNLSSKYKEDFYSLFLLGRPDFDHKRAQDLPKLLKAIRHKGINIEAKILAGTDHPLAKENGVKCLGKKLSDEEMFEEIRRSNVAVSLSTWEGFNLPLVESQEFTPTFCLSVGAHSEVVNSAGQLCQDIDDMAEKIYKSIIDNLISRTPTSYSKRTWLEVSHDFESILLEEFSTIKPSEIRTQVLLFQATNAYLDDANSGVVRVTRALFAELIQRPELMIIPFIFNGQEFVVPTNLGNLLNFTELEEQFTFDISPWKLFAGFPVTQISEDLGPEIPIKVLNTEVIVNQELNFAWKALRKRVNNISFLVHDLIPLLRPDLVSNEVQAGFLSYLETLENANQLLTNSQTTFLDYKKYDMENGINRDILKLGLGVNRSLPAQLIPKTNQVLMVSTLEPRKNHENVLKAFAEYNSQRELSEQLKLLLVGNSYGGDSQTLKLVKDFVESNTWVEYLGVVSDSLLKSIYENSSFTVFASMVEGYGLPILESLAHGVPVLCHNQGVMAEHAISGGCLTVDMTRVDMIIQSLEVLTNPIELQKLRKEAFNRTFESWNDICDRLIETLVLKSSGKIKFPSTQNSIEFIERDRHLSFSKERRYLNKALKRAIKLFGGNSVSRKVFRRFPAKLKYKIWKISH